MGGGALTRRLTSLATQGEVGGGQRRLFRPRLSACSYRRCRGVGGSVLAGELVAMFGRWQRRVSVGALGGGASALERR